MFDQLLIPETRNPRIVERDWDNWLLDLDVRLLKDALHQTYLVAKTSADPSGQNGARIFNFAPRGLGDLLASACTELVSVDGLDVEAVVADRPTKYMYVEHAERNAIYQAAQVGHRLMGSIMVCPWFACSDCARAIVRSGIGLVIGHLPRIEEFNRTRTSITDGKAYKWAPGIDAGDRMLASNGVRRIYFTERLGLDFTIKVNEFDWTP